MPLSMNMKLGDTLVLDGVTFELVDVRMELSATLKGSDGSLIGIDDESAVQAVIGVFVQIRPATHEVKEISLVIDPLLGVKISRGEEKLPNSEI